MFATLAARRTTWSVVANGRIPSLDEGVRCPGKGSRASLLVAVLLLITMLVSGCDSGDPRGRRVAVEGQVLLDDQPLQAGVILFHCGQGDDQMTAFGFIEDGVYAIAKNEGPLVGTARVEFQSKPVSQEELEAALDAAIGTRKRPQLDVVTIPPQYGRDSELTREVTEHGDNRFDFDLRSKR